MSYPIELKEKVVKLRKGGYSLNKIHGKFGISKGILSGWVRDVKLNKKAKSRLLKRIKLGQFISAENKKKKTKQILDNYYQESLKSLEHKDLDKLTIQTICSLIYYCEGNKDLNGVHFTNSDPKLIRTFLFLFRQGFDIK
jgi:transposase